MIRLTVEFSNCFVHVNLVGTVDKSVVGLEQDVTGVYTVILEQTIQTSIGDVRRQIAYIQFKHIPAAASKEKTSKFDTLGKKKKPTKHTFAVTKALILY